MLPWRFLSLRSDTPDSKDSENNTQYLAAALQRFLYPQEKEEEDMRVALFGLQCFALGSLFIFLLQAWQKRTVIYRSPADIPKRLFKSKTRIPGQFLGATDSDNVRFYHIPSAILFGSRRLLSLSIIESSTPNRE